MVIEGGFLSDENSKIIMRLFKLYILTHLFDAKRMRILEVNFKKR